MTSLFSQESLSYRKKVLLTILIAASVIAAGVSYQFYYHLKRIKYREILIGYYRKYTHAEPQEIPLRHLVNLSVNRWGLKRVEKVFFIGEKA